MSEHLDEASDESGYFEEFLDYDAPTEHWPNKEIKRICCLGAGYVVSKAQTAVRTACLELTFVL